MSKYGYYGGWSDVRAKKTVEENIFVFAPTKKLPQLEQGCAPTAEDLEELYCSVINQELVHAGNLDFLHGPRYGKNLWWKYTKCDTPVKFKSHWRDVGLEKWGIKTFFLCPGCGLHIGSRLDDAGFQRLLLFLMLKNVIPEMNGCNMIDASYGHRWSISFSREDQEALKTGRRNTDQQEEISPAYFRPGFIPACERKNSSFFYESHAWLKLLFIKYKNHIDDQSQKIFRYLEGPRKM